MLRYPFCRAPKRLGPLLRLLGLVLAMAWAAAEGRDLPRHPVQIVTAERSETTRMIVDDLLRRFPSAEVISDVARRLPKTSKTVHIAIGPAALRVLLSQGADGVIVSAYTSSQAYRAILDSLPESRSAAVTAIYAEPSPALQLRLIALLYKRPVRVAAILSDKTAYLEPILRSAAALTDTDLSVEYYSAGESLNRTLSRLAEIPVILATPDSLVYNTENIRNILVTTYRRNQSVIGFSASLVKAGALASAYSEIADIGAQIAELVRDFEASGKLPEPQFPKYFSVAVNEDVARSLNIVADEPVRTFSRHAAGGQK